MPYLFIALPVFYAAIVMMLTLTSNAPKPKPILKLVLSILAVPVVWFACWLMSVTFIVAGFAEQLTSFIPGLKPAEANFIFGLLDLALPFYLAMLLTYTIVRRYTKGRRVHKAIWVWIGAVTLYVSLGSGFVSTFFIPFFRSVFPNSDAFTANLTFGLFWLVFAVVVPVMIAVVGVLVVDDTPPLLPVESTSIRSVMDVRTAAILKKKS